MQIRRFIRCLSFTLGMLLLTVSVEAQVDWSDLFPEEGGKPAAQAPRQPQPGAPAASSAAAVRPARPAPRVVKPHVAAASARHGVKPKSQRRIVQPLPSEDREFPAAAEVAPPRFDRSSQRTHTASVAAGAPRAADVVPAAAEPLRQKADAVAPVAVAERPASVLGDSSAPPAPENVPARVVARQPEPGPEAAVVPSVVNRARKATASQRAVQPAPEPEEEEERAAEPEPLQVAAAPAEAAILPPTSHSTHRDSAGAEMESDAAAAGVHPGEVITDKNMDKYAHLLSPGIEWAIRYGLRMKVVAPRHIEMPKAYREATEQHAGQAKLGPDGLRVLNWKAGQPFPVLDPNDPQIALKIMWNFSYGFGATDDLNAENFDADTGTMGKNRGMTVERHYMIDNLRHLNYTGRLIVDPKPSLPNPEDLRYKESLHPLSEPFDLKGVGFTSNRYNDPERQDDSWLYLPQLRRVRRLSTAQRSDALFGQDSDIDSYYGYNGHIAWMDWKFLGERTVLAVMHGEHAPVKWQEPEDWVFDDGWEPRKVYVVEGTSKLSQYAYGKRVIFIDKEGWVVTHSDIYDRAGQLWKVWLNDYSFKKEVIPGARVSRYPDEMAFVHAIVMLDTQLVHSTRAALPSTHSQGEECIFINMGAKSGTSEDFFSVANLIESGH